MGEVRVFKSGEGKDEVRLLLGLGHLAARPGLARGA